MSDKVKAQSIALFVEMEPIIEKNNIPEEAVETFKEMYMNVVADLTIHFASVVDVNQEGFELWKRTMGLHDYCKGCIEELEYEFNWDVNWFKHEFDYDIAPIYKYIYQSFLALC